ncbi:hypothetical protein [Streptomyces sp. CB01881]|uniref:hypothetical protein n=1 Tax=Streptomyces sp. CB01881 TaxID=2078691 RepID=UPI00129C781F|nr:hypothetical protein [Streptomyces sp. CB01881]
MRHLRHVRRGAPAPMPRADVLPALGALKAATTDRLQRPPRPQEPSAPATTPGPDEL